MSPGRLCRRASDMGHPRSRVYTRETRPLRTAPPSTTLQMCERGDFHVSRYWIEFYRSLSPTLLMAPVLWSRTNTKSTSARIRALSWRKAKYYAYNDEANAASPGHTQPVHAISARGSGLASPVYLRRAGETNAPWAFARAPRWRVAALAADIRDLRSDTRTFLRTRLRRLSGGFFAILMQPRTYEKQSDQARGNPRPPSSGIMMIFCEKRRMWP